jgi:Ca2+/Na+ antiporter
MFQPTHSHRLSFITEQVALHTNGTIGALLNATFGNAPELLIATAALRSGFYRVVQLAMLGSMLTNLLFVFGLSCLVGGLRWQVQELRITSGNVSVGMLLLSTAASLLPASLIMSGQLMHDGNADEELEEGVPSREELLFCRINAFIMVFMYVCYLVFQLGTHKEEFDDDENVVEAANGHSLHLSPHFTAMHGRQRPARRNLFCLKFMSRMGDEAAIRHSGSNTTSGSPAGGEVELSRRGNFSQIKQHGSNRSLQEDDNQAHRGGDDSSDGSSEPDVEDLLFQDEPASSGHANGYHNDGETSNYVDEEAESVPGRRRVKKRGSKRKQPVQPRHNNDAINADPGHGKWVFNGKN